MKKEVIKLKEGNSVIYQDKTLMEKANVVSIDKKNGTAILSNKVIITRTTNLEGQFTRLDGKGNAIILPCTTENEQKYNSFVAYHQSKKSLEAIKKWLDDNGKHKDDVTLEKVITLAKKLKKLIEKLNELYLDNIRHNLWDMPNPLYTSNQDVMSRNQDDKTSSIIPYNLVSITFISYLPNIL